ncbi:protein-tyrosine phosphatase-like protein [Peziza echinospora]|nr:protein-tyrosine phosphatase-like protein [Peziza echinospora]
MAKDTHTTLGIEQANSFEQIFNFRDVGAAVNEFLGKRVVREGFLFRSGRLDEATPQDRAKLVQEYAIKTVIDLRTNTERIVRHERSIAHESSNSAPKNPSEPPLSSNTHRILVIGKRLELALLLKLSWFNFFKTIFLLILGYRLEAIKIMSREVIIPQGLGGMGRMALLHSRKEIRRMFEILTTPGGSSFPVLIHCTQGKDRTGLMILIILLCLQTSPSILSDLAIDHDYQLSRAGLLPIREKMVVEVTGDAGLPAYFADIHPNFVEEMVEFIGQHWGGISGYLTSIGLDADAMIGELRERLLV